MQPGDNYRVAASPERQFWLELGNDDKLQNQGANTKERNANKQRIVTPGMVAPNNPASLAQAELRKPQNYATDVLTTWRFVHVEVDSMGKMKGNYIDVNTAQSYYVQDPKTQEKFLRIVLDKVYNTAKTDFSKNRFENGTYTDSQAGVQFRIRGNGNIIGNQLISYVDVYPRQDGKQPTVPGKARLKDDDHLAEGQDVPMPDTSQLEPALADAFIIPLINGDNDDLPFSVFTSLDVNSPDYYQTKMEWDTKNVNTPEHWTIYLFGAFEENRKNDNDPDSEAPLSGYTDGKNGGSIIWIETAHDFAREEQVNPSIFEQDTVVHEVAHALARIPDEDNPKTPAIEGPTNYSDVPSRFSDHYIDAIRASKFPVGASQ